MEIWLALFALVWIVGAPLVALVLAIVAYQRATRAESRAADAGRPSAGPATKLAIPDAAPRRASEPAHAPEAAPPEAPAEVRAEVRPEALPEARPDVPPEAPPEAPARPSPGWEERLGARLPVWLGGAALAFAGIFLVHYSIQNDWITPAARVVLGALAGLACVVLGEFFSGRSFRIGAALSSAGIAAIYAALVAATSLYALVGPVTGFLLIVLTTLAAVALSLRRGPIVALIGLLGGFVTPALVGAGDQRPYLLFGFFLALQAALLVVVRRRSWWPLSALASLGGFCWVVAWLVRDDRLAHVPLLGAFLLTSCAALVVAVMRPGEAGQDPRARALASSITLVNCVATLVLVAVTVQAGAFGLVVWMYLAVLGLGALLLARLDDRYIALPALAAAATLAMLASRGWAGTVSESAPRAEPLVACFGALYFVAPYLAHLRARGAAAFAWIGSVSLLAHFGLAWALFEPRYRTFSWSALAITLALVVLLAALPHLRARLRGTCDEGALAAFLVAATAFVSVAVPLELERAWIGVAWAIEAALLAWLAGWLRVPTLRVLSATLMGMTLVRLLLNPYVLDYPFGSNPLVHWIHYGYGVPIAALALAAFLYARERDERLALFAEIGAALLAVAYVGLAIRQGFAPGRLLDPVRNFAELGAYGVGWLLLAALLLGIGARFRRESLTVAGRCVGLGALAYVVFGPGLVANPAWAGLTVGGWPLANALLLAFGVPALLAVLLREGLGAGQREVRILLGAAGTWLLFVWTSLEVRRGFRGVRLDLGASTDTELYAYSAAWVLLGTLLLVLGIWRRSTLLRFASLASMLAAVAKVFLYDFRSLEGLLRVFSFLGLGVSLLLLAFLYQRFVFRDEERRASA